jgi:hypothetical protein
MNYSMTNMGFGVGDSVANFSLYTLKAFDVKVFNYSLEATIAPIYSVPAIVDA